MFLIQCLRLFLRSLTAECSYREIAAGLAGGVLLGLVPKGNLLAVMLMIGVSSVRLSLPALFFSTFLFSWIAISLDGVCSSIGEFLLTNQELQPLWIWLYNQPVIPWTDFNNTIVLGSFVLGSVLIVPSYCAALPLTERYTPIVIGRMKKYRLATWLWGAEWAERVRSAI
ncbi:TIGR03546 family protein [Rubinisphaera margarita]|uniref:TIGR03546 family protein n=1 Tax=Rubinisphaera margarita TaxID=2909586 RepID=UPI001EE8A596|nr:TIGR03546 family protein [Rubinisphaera margarita]MCG6156142.1 TIGR03546 family protein [Rubinisphaera margarita]